jgi:hypothetical protein
MVVQNGEAAALGERATPAGREGNRTVERCGEARGGCSPFIGPREHRGGVAEAVNAGINGFNAIEDGPA